MLISDSDFIFLSVGPSLDKYILNQQSDVDGESKKLADMVICSGWPCCRVEFRSVGIPFWMLEINISECDINYN